MSSCAPPVAAVVQTGEWDLPLAPEKLEAMRKVMAAQSEGLDESLLAACYSWMRKSAEEKLDGAWRGRFDCGMLPWAMRVLLGMLGALALL